MSELTVERFELPSLPAPRPGDAPIMEWDEVAELRVGHLISAVRRFTYWDEKDNKPLEVGFEAYIDGLPENCGIADIVATHPDVFADLAVMSAKVAELLRECRLVHAGICAECHGTEKVRMSTGKWTYTAPCPACCGEDAFLAGRIDGDHFIIGPAK